MTLCSFGRSVFGFTLVRGLATVSIMRATISWTLGRFRRQQAANIPCFERFNRGRGVRAASGPTASLQRSCADGETPAVNGSNELVVRKPKFVHIPPSWAPIESLASIISFLGFLLNPFAEPRPDGGRSAASA